MKMFELLPRPLGSIFRKLTHFTCNSRNEIQSLVEMSDTGCRASNDECRPTFGHAGRVTLPAVAGRPPYRASRRDGTLITSRWK